MLNRRNLLITGTAIGASALLYGCGSGSDDTGAETIGQADVSTDAPAQDGEIALYTGERIEPINGQPINNPAGMPDRALGGVDAEVTLIEYLSPTCPHCASFHNDVLPQLKQAYIDTGRIRFIGRPFRRNVLDLAVFMVAESAGDSYYDILDAYMANQNQWMTADNPRQAIFEIAQQFGFTQERFEEILTDQEMFAALEAVREQALDEFGVQGTPTFFLNGERLSVNARFEAMSAEIEALL